MRGDPVKGLLPFCFEGGRILADPDLAALQLYQRPVVAPEQRPVDRRLHQWDDLLLGDLCHEIDEARSRLRDQGIADAMGKILDRGNAVALAAILVLKS